MPDAPNLSNAPAHLLPLLRRLPVEASGFTVGQHANDPHSDEWFAGFDNCGDAGPFASAEDAIIGGVRWLVGLYRDARNEADAGLAGPWCSPCGEHVSGDPCPSLVCPFARAGRAS